MNLAREISRLLFGLLLVFGLIGLAATYWAIAGADSILLRDDNPRLVIAESQIRRGSIVDRKERELALSLIDAGTVIRQYPHANTSTVTGYSSLRYGVGGAEAIYDAILRGDTLSRDLVTSLTNKALHRPNTGSSVKLSIDLDIQQAMAQALDDQQGAAVILSVPDGAVLAMVSLPGYDPNLLDSEWDLLVEDPDKPFFNRVLQGSYQPGGMLQTPLMAAALVQQVPLNTLIEQANQSVILDDVELGCALRIPFSEMSLRDAYAFACPQPFANLAQELGLETFDATTTTFRFAQPVSIQGYFPETGANSAAVNASDDASLTEQALGQGSLTVTPLQMAVITAAIINDGNAPQPYLLAATQSPDAATWTNARTSFPTMPFTTQITARELQDLMRYAVANGASLNAARPGIDIGGHAALAFSGDESLAWFTGFATLAGRRGVAVAVVLENSADPGLAADIGGTILAAAQGILTQS